MKTKQMLKLFPLFIVLLFAFYLRSSGLFDNFHTDEQAVMNPVESMSKEYSLDPNYYERPNHVSIYLNFIVQNAYSIIRFHEPLSKNYDSHTTEYFAVARALNAAIGTAMIVLAFFIGLEFSRRLALIFGLLFSFFPIFVEHSHFITPDIPTACLTLIMIFISIKLVKSFTKRKLILLCLFCALNIIEKYPGLISILLVFFSVSLYRYNKDGKLILKKILYSCFISGLVVIFFCYVLSPSLFIHPKETIKSIFSESGGHIGADNFGFWGNLIFYGKTFFISAGLISLFFFGIWILRVIKTDKSAILKFIPLYYGFCYWILLSLLKLHWVRWGMPMYITPLFCIGLGLDYLINFRYIKHAALALFSIIIINSAICAAFTVIDFHVISTVNSSKDFARKNGITPDNTIYEGYTTFYEYRTRNIDWFEKKDLPQYSYVILSSAMKDRFRQEPKRDPVRIKAYDEIEQHELLTVIKPTEKPSISLFEFRNFCQFPRYIYNAIRHNFKGYYKGPTLWFYKK